MEGLANREMRGVLMGITAMRATPRNAIAQRFVDESSTNTFGKPEPATETAISTNFITGLSGQRRSRGRRSVRTYTTAV